MDDIVELDTLPSSMHMYIGARCFISLDTATTSAGDARCNAAEADRARRRA